MAVDYFVILTSPLDPGDGLPTEVWTEVATRGNEADAAKLAATLRDNSHAVRVLPNDSFDYMAFKAAQAAALVAPTDLYAAAVIDPLVGHAVVHDSGWTPNREEAQARAHAVGGTVVTASGSGPRRGAA